MDAAPRAMRSRLAAAALASPCCSSGWALFAGGASGTSATALARDGGRRRRGARRRRLVAGSVAAAPPRSCRRRWQCGRGRARRLDRPDRLVVDRRRPLLGRARQGHRAARVRRRRPRWPPALPGRPVRTLALVLAAALGAVLVWALLGKAIPALGPDDAGRVARLKGSIGYWNALALLADAALGLGLWLVVVGARPLRPSGRRAAPLRGDDRDPADPVARRGARRGRRRRPRRSGCRSIASRRPCSRCSPAGPALVVAGWAFTRPALVEDGGCPRRSRLGRRRARRADAGRRCRSSSRSSASCRSAGSSRPGAGRSYEGSSAPVAVARRRRRCSGSWHVGNPLTWAADQLTSSGEVDERARAPRQPRDEQPHRLVGRGVAGVPRPPCRRHGRADVRDRAQARSAATPQNVSEPHSVPLQLLSDTGPAGVRCSGSSLVVGVGLGMRAALRRLDAGERAAAVGLARASARVRAACPRRLRPRLPRRRRADGARLGGAARRRPPGRRSRAGGLWCRSARSWARPPRSGCSPRRRSRRGSSTPPTGRADAGDFAAAAASARRAQTPEPALARAARRPGDGRGLAGDKRAAETFYEQATRLQPENPATWYSSASSATSRGTCAAPTSRSTPPTPSTRRAACSPGRRARPGARRRQRSRRPCLRKVAGGRAVADAGQPRTALCFALGADDDDRVGAVQLRRRAGRRAARRSGFRDRARAGGPRPRSPCGT